MTAKHLTVRGIPREVALALEKEKRRRGSSLNQTVIDLLRSSLGVSGERRNGLAKLAGTWTEAQHREFLAHMKPFEEIDGELWK